jgi:uncharacterized protein
MPPCETSNVAQFVVKITKYCNLRCAYCYEYPHLGDKARMSLETLGRIFENIARPNATNRYDSVNFVWHGGEPFLVPLEYYEAIGELQQQFFSPKFAVSNVVQTNLTVLTPAHLDHLRAARFFSGLGVSFDVYGDQRVDAAGRLRTETVLKNIQALLDQGISFGAIAVLARNTLPHARRIYRFYDQLGIACRFLPFYQSASEDQLAAHAITYVELVEALKAIFDEWLRSERATPVDPVDSYMDYAVAHIIGSPPYRYDKESDELIFVVDIDGGVWGPDEIYGDQSKYGNLLDDGFDAILRSKGRRRAVERAWRRQMQHCSSCPYFGACPGHFVGDASPQQQHMLAKSGCPVRPVLDHIVGELERTEISERILAHSSRSFREEHAALTPSL